MFVCHRVVRDPAALASVAADREVQETFGQEDEELLQLLMKEVALYKQTERTDSGIDLEKEQVSLALPCLALPCLAPPPRRRKETILPCLALSCIVAPCRAMLLA
eukprot:COSAG06_NODE_1054_length_10948_cov_36.868006_2_plen_105_part_00